ncbi:2-hydroxyacid dehydrogenase [Acuticoccus sp.]|uniref:2-hydroxyacid dehydrogenase n=1 Tax=Acuticoccus sp. TaxID=1904378 RepID=UPI003B52D7D5
MSGPHVLMADPMMDSVVEALRPDFILHDLTAAADKDALLDEVGGEVRGLLTAGGKGAPKSVLDRLPKLQMISSFGVGYDGLDLGYCRERGLRVTNTPDVLNDAMAETTLGLMIALAREIPQADAYVRSGRWSEANYKLTAELTGKTLGIVGLGRIGKEVARRAQAFKMQVVYHGRHEQPFEPYRYYADLVEMAQAADWLVNITPGGAATDKMLGGAVFDALGEEGYLVNVGRGSTVDEAALIAALSEGRIAGAALDVFEDEPHVPEALRTMQNVVLSPHQGSATRKTRWMMGDLVVRNLKAHFAGDPLITPVA